MTSPHPPLDDIRAGVTGNDDASMRARYRDAQAHISGATLARLHQARHAALQAEAGRRRPWAWPLAASFAALFALAVGMQVLGPPGATPDVLPAGDVVAVVDAALPAADVADADVDDAAAAYDESPDFYLWLASNEATLLALE